MIEIYKNTISESDRLKVLAMIENLPDVCWTQSICTDSSVDQLREYLPMEVFRIVNDMHKRVQLSIEQDFNVELETPEYKIDSIITVDRRLEGYFLPKHQDIPTGDYIHHIGSETGKSKVEISCVYYWNSDFTGGELFFEDDDILYAPVAGDLVIFYSSMDHEIRRISSGKRYSTQYFFNRR